MIEAHKNRSSEAMSNPFNNSSGSECRVTEAAFHHVLHVAQFATIALDAALRVEAHEVATDDPVARQALVAPRAPGDLERAGEDCFLTRALGRISLEVDKYPIAISISDFIFRGPGTEFAHGQVDRTAEFTVTYGELKRV